MKTSVKVAVVLASYNGSKYIVEQITSILNQIKVDVHIFVFDDNSNDDTISVLSKFKLDERVSIIGKKERCGSAAKNFFYGLAYLNKYFKEKFHYIAFSDQDDIWLENKLYRAVSELNSANAYLYMSNLTIWHGDNAENSTLKKSANQKEYDFLFEGGSAGCTYVFDSVLFNELTKTLENLEFNKWTYLSHDWLVYFVARINKMKVYIDDESHILYRIHDNNVHGHMNTASYKGISEKLNLIRNGWYVNHINGYKQLLDLDSKEYLIYKMYSKNIFTRLFVLLKYNFSLLRSTKKFLVFFFLSMMPIKSKYKGKYDI